MLGLWWMWVDRTKPTLPFVLEVITLTICRTGVAWLSSLRNFTLHISDNSSFVRMLFEVNCLHLNSCM